MTSTLVEDFLGYLQTIRGASSKTIKEYRYDLYTFLQYMKIRKENNISSGNSNNLNDTDISTLTVEFLNSIGLQDLYSYLSYLDIHLGNNSSTRARKIASIRSFFRYYYKQLGLLTENISEKLETPKIGKKNPVYLTLDECHRLLKSIQHVETSTDFIKNRDLAIVVLFLNTGMRLSELSGIDIDMFKENTVTVVGKGNKERTIYLNEACLLTIDRYLAVRPKTENEKALFLSTRKSRISNRAIQYRIDFYLQLSGFDTEVYSAHKLRHTAATLMYKYGKIDIRTLQQILGHASVSTTQIYTHLDDETLKSAVESNPLARMDLE